MAELARLQKDLRNVLLYTQELVSFRDKIVLDIAAAPYPTFYEAALLGLEGIQSSPDRDTWMRLRRLRESQPPAPDVMFEGWTKDAPHPSPDKPPTLVGHRMVRLPVEEISDLAEAGLIDPDDVMRPRDADEDFPEAMDVILRTARMTEFREAWKAHLDGTWAKWAEVERPRRRSIEIYNKLYEVQQRVTSSGEDNAIELIWGVGVARWEHSNGRINVPVLEQQVELELLDDGTLLVAPRQVPPVLALKPFHALEVEGSKSLQREAAEKLARVVEDPDIAFSPFERKSFELLLRSCAAQLSATGSYVPDEEGHDPTDRSLRPIDGTLRITDTWVIYVRQRAEDVRKEDIQRLIRQVERAESEDQLPAAALQFVKPPSDERTYEGAGFDLGNAHWRLPEEPAPGWNPSSGGGHVARGAAADGGKAEPAFFFPLPYNNDQRDILRRLEGADGVVVQGPPGTGKTHTIANVICHFLATGKRVLVTAKTAEALTALHDKLPPGIRDLAISVIHNDREGARQLERAVEVLANEAKQVKEHEIARDILDRQRILAETHDRVAAIDAELLAYARRNLEEVESGGERHLPMMLARRVMEDRDRHLWFEDAMDLSSRFEPCFSDVEMAEARVARTKLGDDIMYSTDDLPDPGALIDLARLLAAHGELAREKAIDEKARSGNIPYMAVAALEQARAAHIWLKDLGGFFEEARAEVWLVPTYQTLCGARKSDEAAAVALTRALEQWARLYDKGRELALKGVDPGDVPIEDQAFDVAVAKLARGERPFGLFAFGNGQLKGRIGNVTVGGCAPSSTEAWQEVRDFRAWQREAQTFLRQWSALCTTLNLPPVPTEWRTGRGELIRLGRLVASLLRFASEASARVAELQRLFPYGLDAMAAIHEGQVSLALQALSANLEKAELADAHAVKKQLEALSGGRSLPFHSAVADLCESLGDASVAPTDLAEGWRQICGEAARLAGLRPLRVRLEDIAKKVRHSGAPIWAERLVTDPVLGGRDPWTPADWRDSWDWKRADGFVRGLADRATVEQLTGERDQLDVKQRALLAEVVRLRTFLGLKQRMSSRIEVALAKFAAAVARLGAGTGKAARRHRRVIRDATLDAAAAVPCWILPEWRVSEQLPADLAAFDLVIIDEASQSDITALPTILRGKKLLVVGDDKQISPTHVGLDERTVIQLRTTFLSGLPFADQMDPATSLYELGGMLFPGKAILLREHFRCVEAIIRFSSRFYPSPLVPMRLPTAKERLDPPLIDILVRDGEKKGDLNTREAAVVVEEIRRLAEDPIFANRTVGVISLIGDKQAKLIYDRLMRELGAEVMVRHRIMCGNASTFQGQERDIVFLTMVACPNTATAQRSRMYEQRFNVAMSRARDQLVLVRSVTSSDLNPGDLKLQVIEHFRNPMGDGKIAARKDILEACDSEFEKVFGAHLIDMGYRIRAQVPVAGYYIDFVVEGANDRRLAIELDGDRWHGPDRWAADFQRQISLERLGWTFWRCWGSSWMVDPGGCLADLTRTLGRMGIDPLGAEPVQGAWTMFREFGKDTESDLIEQTFDLVDELASGLGLATETARANVASAPTDAAVPAAAYPEIDVGAVEAGSLVVEVGDLVVVRYDDEPNRAVRVRLSCVEHKPEIGVIHVSQPLAQALMGRAIEEEIDVDVGNRTRSAVIELIERDNSMGEATSSPAPEEGLLASVPPR